jgi:hypothetical protein
MIKVSFLTRILTRGIPNFLEGKLDSHKKLSISHNTQVLVPWLVAWLFGDHLLLSDFANYGLIFMLFVLP